MENEYSVENLIDRFQKHLNIIRQQQREWEEANPGRKFGDEYPDGDFNISEALMNMCMEIAQIKLHLHHMQKKVKK